MVGDVSLGSDGLRVIVRKSKTDQLGVGKCLVLQRLGGCRSCPAKVFQEFMQVRASGMSEALLIHRDGSCLSRFQFIAVLKVLGGGGTVSK